MTYQEIEHIKDATYKQTTRITDSIDQYHRDVDAASCRAWGEFLQIMDRAEWCYSSVYSDDMKAAMWEDMFNSVKDQATRYFGYYAAKCDGHGKEKR